MKHPNKMKPHHTVAFAAALLIGGIPSTSIIQKTAVYDSNQAHSAIIEIAAGDALTDDITKELDAYWKEASRTVAEGDFEGYAATYHPDAVLVSEAQGTSYPIATALAGWKSGFDDTKAGKMKAGVEFRFTKRLYNETTAHETGIFYYVSTPRGGSPTGYRIHFQGLLVKKDGEWKLVMEHQQHEATMEEWNAAGHKN